MTVRELCEELFTMDPDANVVLCHGNGFRYKLTNSLNAKNVLRGLILEYYKERNEFDQNNEIVPVVVLE